MFDQLLGLLLLGLGLKNPMTGEVAGSQSNTNNGTIQGNFESNRGRNKKNNERISEVKDKLNYKYDDQRKIKADKLLVKIGELNTRTTQKMTARLAKLSEVLDKMKTRASDLQAKGLDTSTVEEKLATAESTLEVAKNAVAAQAGKMYAVFSSDSDISTNASTSINGLKNDLRQVKATIVAAKQSLKDAAVSLRALSNEPMITSTPAP